LGVDLSRIRKTAGDFGWSAVLGSVARGAVNRVVFFRELKCVTIRDVDPTYLAIDPRFHHGFLDEPALRRFSGEPPYDLSAPFLDEALANGDECYAILDGDRLASFGWYSRVTTKVTHQIVFQFDRRHVYMYKGYTDPAYRGRRLHAIGMTWALQRFRERGADGLISYVDASNFDSLRSCYRMGYRDIGHMYYMHAAGRSWMHTDAACRRFGASLEAI
jgi:GNAT superfamily N-acetyltransferase